PADDVTASFTLKRAWGQTNSAKANKTATAVRHLVRIRSNSGGNTMRRVNIWAVLVSAVVFWLVGGLWYGLLFGQRWLAVVGKTEAQLKAINPIPNYVLAFVLEIVIAGAIGWVT